MSGESTASTARAHHGGDRGRRWEEKKEEEKLIHRGKCNLVRDKNIVTALEHAIGKALHDWLSLQVQVTKHCVALPAANETDGVTVDLGVEQRHCAASTKGACADITFGKVVLWTNDSCGLSKGRRNVFGVDFAGTASDKKGCNNGSGSGKVRAKMDNATDNGTNRAKDVMATEAMVDNFTPYAILLSGKGEGDTCCRPELCGGGTNQWDDDQTNAQLNILEAEWRIIICSAPTLKNFCTILPEY